jgi:hypothetical protein
LRARLAAPPFPGVGQHLIAQIEEARWEAEARQRGREEAAETED